MIALKCEWIDGCDEPAEWEITGCFKKRVGPGRNFSWFYCANHARRLQTEGDPKGQDAHRWKRITAPQVPSPRIEAAIAAE